MLAVRDELEELIFVPYRTSLPVQARASAVLKAGSSRLGASSTAKLPPASAARASALSAVRSTSRPLALSLIANLFSALGLNFITASRGSRSTASFMPPRKPSSAASLYESEVCSCTPCSRARSSCA